MLVSSGTGEGGQKRPFSLHQITVKTDVIQCDTLGSKIGLNTHGKVRLMARKEFSQEAVAEMFASYLDMNNFQRLPHDAGQKAMKEILKIDYRPFLRSPNFIDIYTGRCIEILVANGSSPDNAKIFAEAMIYVTNDDNGFGDAMKEFMGEYVEISTEPPEPDDPEVVEYGESYGQIMLVGFDPELHINNDGSFNFQNPPGVGVKYHDPKTDAIISVGASTGLGVFVAVSGPITPAVLAIGAAIVIGAIVLNKILKKSC